MDQRRRSSRPKPQVSCTICKSKKVRCDRKLPCANCRRRPPGSCVYVSKTIKGSSSASLAFPRQDDDDHTASSRSEHYREPATMLPDEDTNTGGPKRETDSPLLIDSDHDTGPSSNSSRRLSANGLETRFLDAANWEALIRDASFLKVDEHHAGHLTSTLFCFWRNLRPSLLFGSSRDQSYEELVNHLPAKPVVDQLVNLFVTGADIPTLPVHLPVFLKDYQLFWDSPGRVSLPWLSILFSIITLTLQYVLRSGSAIDGILYIELACRKFASKAAEYLRTFDYAKPAPRTVEAMIKYMLCEHMWLGEYHLRASLILSLTIRLAMRAGYHRDPSHYSQLPIFEVLKELGTFWVRCILEDCGPLRPRCEWRAAAWVHECERVL
ncbi:hypothetical protein V2G26_012870 [Clonostachys chloroleuca]